MKVGDEGILAHSSTNKWLTRIIEINDHTVKLTIINNVNRPERGHSLSGTTEVYTIDYLETCWRKLTKLHKALK